MVQRRRHFLVNRMVQQSQLHRWCRYFLQHLVALMCLMDLVPLEDRKDPSGLMRRLIQ